MSLENATVAVIGGGFSGLMTCYHLLAHGPSTLCVTLFEPHPERFGPAYSTDSPSHLLNVRTKNMGAFPGAPLDFLLWIEKQGKGVVPDGFVPRRSYRQYLNQILVNLSERHSGRFQISRTEVISLDRQEVGWRLFSSDGLAHTVQRVVLAIGEGSAVKIETTQSESRVIQDPWEEDLASSVKELHLINGKGEIVIFGSGLSAVDIVLSLQDLGHKGPITLLSRHGLLPMEHESVHPFRGDISDPPWLAHSLSAMLRRYYRAVDEAANRQSAFEWLRPYIQRMWLGLSQDDRARFYRWYRPYWNVFRHRMAPATAGRIQTLKDSGQLRVIKGSLTNIESDGSSLRVNLHSGESLKTELVINCSGAAAKGRFRTGLLGELMSRGLISADALRLGLQTSRQGECIGADGRESNGIFCVGGLRKGMLWETTAVPDLRVQALEVALSVLGSGRN